MEIEDVYLKTVFKYKDKVFDFYHGWGFVKHFTIETIDDIETVHVFVKFQNKIVKYNANGSIIDLAFKKPLLNPTLSFTEYTLQGFSQERTMKTHRIKHDARE